MRLRVTWRQVLAWRMRRQSLDPLSDLAPVEVVRRLCGVQAQVASAAELAVRIRRLRPVAGEVTRALRDGELIKTWAMRGTLHYLPADEAGNFLSLIAAARPWARPSWVRYFGVNPEQMEMAREAVGEALTGRTLTREELIEALTAKPGLEHLSEALRSGWGTLLKPLAWQGVLCFGPSQGNRVTFMRPNDASNTWRGVPPADEAAPLAIAAYLAAHGPAGADAFGHWLAGGWFGKRQLRAWFAALSEQLIEVDLEGEPAYVLADHVDELASIAPSAAVRLLGGFDQYVLGAGTADPHVVPPGRRAAVSRQAGWISPVVIVGGVVCGTWRLDDSRLTVEWFGDMGKPPKKALEKEVERLAGVLAKRLELSELTTV